jgi:hypothetical protein
MNEGRMEGIEASKEKREGTKEGRENGKDRSK